MSRKTPIKHIVRSHTRGSSKVSPYWRGRGQRQLVRSMTPPSYLGSPVEVIKDPVTGINYKIINNTAYHVDTPEAVIRILENNRRDMRGKRLKFYFGDKKTGRDWEEVYDTEGYVGRSTGLLRIPLLIKNTRSMGGGALLDDSIVKITETTAPRRVLYEHPKYHKGGN